jgi:hypothetical protein
MSEGDKNAHKILDVKYEETTSGRIMLKMDIKTLGGRLWNRFD